jgi:hypothetical protein
MEINRELYPLFIWIIVIELETVYRIYRIQIEDHQINAYTRKQKEIQISK